MKTSLRNGPFLLALLVLAGCGGHHSSRNDGSTEFATDIKLTVGTGYNGSSADLTGTPVLNPEAAVIEVVLSDKTSDVVRDFFFTVPASSLTAEASSRPPTRALPTPRSPIPGAATKTGPRRPERSRSQASRTARRT